MSVLLLQDDCWQDVTTHHASEPGTRAFKQGLGLSLKARLLLVVLVAALALLLLLPLLASIGSSCS
jgi:hypothetical protein